jgi:HEAT repeat protein
MKPSSSKKDAMEEIMALLSNLKNSDWWVRKETIGKLLDYPEEMYLSDLEEWLRNGNDVLQRNASMEAFKELGVRALGSLVCLLKDEDVDVRIFSANVLGDIKEPSALGSLVVALQDPDENVRVAVAEALGKIGDERAVEALTTALGDMSWAAIAAIEALGRIGGTNALAVLHECLENKDYCGIACSALEKAGDRSSIEHLIPLLKMEDGRELVLQAIVSIAEREKTALPASLFCGDIDLLVAWLGSPQEEIRRAAFIAMSWSNDMRCLPYYLKAFQNDLLLEYAINGLLALGSKAVPEIVETMKKPGKNNGVLAKVLSMIGEKEALMLFAKDEDAEVRTEVALAIGSLRTPELREALQTLSRDPVEEVRAAALLSLRNSEREVQNQ